MNDLDRLIEETRLASILPRNSLKCKYGCPGDPEADLVHCYFTCRLTCELGSWLLSQISLYDPQITPTRLLRVEFEAGAVTEALVWVAAHTLLYCWERRSAGKQASLQGHPHC